MTGTCSLIIQIYNKINRPWCTFSQACRLCRIMGTTRNTPILTSIFLNKLSHSSLSNTSLSHTSLSHTSLSHTSLTHTSLSRSRLTLSRISYSSLSHAHNPSLRLFEASVNPSSKSHCNLHPSRTPERIPSPRRSMILCVTHNSYLWNWSHHLHCWVSKPLISRIAWIS
jgi:hypothetical protein